MTKQGKVGRSFEPSLLPWGWKSKWRHGTYHLSVRCYRDMLALLDSVCNIVIWDWIRAKNTLFYTTNGRGNKIALPVECIDAAITADVTSIVFARSIYEAVENDYNQDNKRLISKEIS